MYAVTKLDHWYYCRQIRYVIFERGMSQLNAGTSLVFGSGTVSVTSGALLRAFKKQFKKVAIFLGHGIVKCELILNINENQILNNYLCT